MICCRTSLTTPESRCSERSFLQTSGRNKQTGVNIFATSFQPVLVLFKFTDLLFEDVDLSVEITKCLTCSRSSLFGFIQANSRDITVTTTKYSLDDENLVPDTEYTARVRSSPNGGSYQGQWSDWSPEVHWKTDPVVEGVNGKSEFQEKTLGL